MPARQCNRLARNRKQRPIAKLPEQFAGWQQRVRSNEYVHVRRGLWQDRAVSKDSKRKALDEQEINPGTLKSIAQARALGGRKKVLPGYLKSAFLQAIGDVSRQRDRIGRQYPPCEALDPMTPGKTSKSRPIDRGTWLPSIRPNSASRPAAAVYQILKFRIARRH